MSKKIFGKRAYTFSLHCNTHRVCNDVMPSVSLSSLLQSPTRALIQVWSSCCRHLPHLSGSSCGPVRSQSHSQDCIVSPLSKGPCGRCRGICLPPANSSPRQNLPPALALPGRARTTWSWNASASVCGGSSGYAHTAKSRR